MYILIVDDYPLFADALRQVLLRLGNHVTIHMAPSTAQALSLLEQGYVYDLMLVDINLPGLDGFGLIRQLRKRFMTMPILMISASDEQSLMLSALEHGARAYLHKSTDARGLLHAAHQVLSGNIYFPDLSMHPLIESENPVSVALGISERQLEILQLLATGLSNKEIARQLAITESTVKTHVSKLMANLVVNNRISCVIEAKRLGLL